MGSLSSRNYILKMMKNRVLPVLALGLMMLLTSCGKEGVDPEEADRKNTGEFTYYSTIPVLGTCHKNIFTDSPQEHYVIIEGYQDPGEPPTWAPYLIFAFLPDDDSGSFEVGPPDSGKPVWGYGSGINRGYIELISGTVTKTGATRFTFEGILTEDGQAWPVTAKGNY